MSPIDTLWLYLCSRVDCLLDTNDGSHHLCLTSVGICRSAECEPTATNGQLDRAAFHNPELVSLSTDTGDNPQVWPVVSLVVASCCLQSCLCL